MVRHSQLLEQLGIGQSCSRSELVTALKVCSLQPAKAEAFAFGGGICVRSIWSMIVMRLRPALFFEAVEMFKAYLESSCKAPGFWADTKQTRDTAMPPVLMIKRDLMHHYGYSESEVDNMPFGKAQFERLAIMEECGAIDFIESDVIEQAKAMAKQIAEEEAASSGK